MKKWLAVVLGVVVLCGPAVADIVWDENFDNTSDWSVWWEHTEFAWFVDTGGGMSDLVVTNPGGIGSFIPDQGEQTLARFDPDRKDQYDVIWDVDSLDDSCSYHILLDQYDSDSNWLSTVTEKITGFDTRTGTVTQNCGGLTFDASTYYVKPKVDITTGTGDQWVRFDDLSMTYTTIPEPTTLALMGLTGVLVVLVRKRHRNKI